MSRLQTHIFEIVTDYPLPRRTSFVLRNCLWPLWALARYVTLYDEADTESELPADATIQASYLCGCGEPFTCTVGDIREALENKVLHDMLGSFDRSRIEYIDGYIGRFTRKLQRRTVSHE